MVQKAFKYKMVETSYGVKFLSVLNFHKLNKNLFFSSFSISSCHSVSIQELIWRDGYTGRQTVGQCDYYRPPRILLRGSNKQLFKDITRDIRAFYKQPERLCGPNYHRRQFHLCRQCHNNTALAIV